MGFQCAQRSQALMHGKAFTLLESCKAMWPEAQTPLLFLPSIPCLPTGARMLLPSGPGTIPGSGFCSACSETLVKLSTPRTHPVSVGDKEQLPGLPRVTTQEATRELGFGAAWG
jgi:hypothetical protein